MPAIIWFTILLRCPMVYRDTCHWAFWFFLIPSLIGFCLRPSHQHVSCSFSLMLCPCHQHSLSPPITCVLENHISIFVESACNVKACSFWVRNCPLSNTFLLLGVNYGNIHDFHHSQSHFTPFQLCYKEDSFLNNWISHSKNLCVLNTAQLVSVSCSMGL